MKRIGYIYDDICSLENCKRAILKASIGKRGRRSVRKVLDNLEHYTNELHTMLKNQTYTPEAYKTMTVVDHLQGKVRETQVPIFFPDLCVQHALLNILAPLLEKRFYHWSAGCRVGKGNRHARKGVERATLNRARKAKYAVKIDIKKCYPSIQSELLLKAFERLIKDCRALWLIKSILSGSEGLPIGSYTSAWFCNWFLTPIDRLIKDTHKINFYVRFIDDMVLIDSNKRKLIRAVKEVEAVLQGMGLKIHANWNVFRVRRAKDGNKGRPIDFVGYRFCLGYTTLRRRNALALMRQSRKIQKLEAQGRPIPFKMAAGFLSRMGQLKHCKATGLWKKYVDVISIKKLKGVVANESKRRSVTAGGV